MLNISRREKQRIMLGDDIVIEVVSISGNTVKLGISAPRELRVYREEIWADIRGENAAAATGTPPAGIPAPVTPATKP